MDPLDEAGVPCMKVKVNWLCGPGNPSSLSTLPHWTRYMELHHWKFISLIVAGPLHYAAAAHPKASRPGHAAYPSL